jgi:hypothetical protein
MFQSHQIKKPVVTRIQLHLSSSAPALRMRSLANRN